MPRFSGLKTLGIRWHLAGLVAGCILPLAAVSVFLILNFYEREQIQLQNSATSRARALMAQVDQDFARTQAALQVLGTSHRLATGDLSGFDARASEALRNIHADSIVVWSRSGQVLTSTSPPPPPLARAPEIAPELKRVMASAEPGVSDLFLDPLTARFNFSVVVPVKENGVPLYWLTANVAPARISQYMVEQKFPDSWRASIVDSAGRVVLRSIDIEKFQGRALSSALLQGMKASAEGAQEGTTLDGISVLTVFSRSPVTRWGVVLGLPLDDLTAGLRQTLGWLIAATLTALLFGVSWAWHFGGRVSGSIQALVAPARALGSGQDVLIPPLHFREANKLGQALLDAASTLQQSNYRAHHDAMTGLANRTLFETLVNGQLALSRRTQGSLAVLYIDLDGFKAVNDQHGHEVGDRLLCEVAARILAAVRESDVAARLGGDEFAVALINAGIESAQAFGRQLIATLSKTYQLGPVQASISASVGVAGYPDSATDIETLLIRADRAMYQAKASGRGQVCVAAE